MVDRTNPPIPEPTMTKRSLTLILPLCAALAVACGSDGGLGPEAASKKPLDANKPVLTRVEVAPDSSRLVPEVTYQLTINVWDQFGARMLDSTVGGWAYKATYVSDAPEVASVSPGGLVTAVTPGVTTITASLTVAGFTRTGSMVAKVDPPTATSVVLTADQNGLWSRNTVSLKTPATVTWVVPDGVQARTIWLDPWGPNPEKLVFTNGVATRTFSAPGDYYYGMGFGLTWDDEAGVIKAY
jgi:hypothetical protein